jgi:hypothetical protein
MIPFSLSVDALSLTAEPRGAHPLGDEFMRECEPIRVRPLGRQQEPTREPLHGCVETIAKGGLR